MTRSRHLDNPFIFFIPTLLIYLVIVMASPTTGTSGDEDRYISYAHNLLHGFYSPPPPNVELTNGPGYPLILAPFLALGLPLICLTILNAIFYYLSNVLVFKSLLLITNRRTSLIFSFLWAFYYVAYQGLPLIHTETFVYLLTSLLSFFVLKCYQGDSDKARLKYSLLAGLLLGYIALTKMIFGHVIIVMTLITLFLTIFWRKNKSYKRALVMLVTALVMTLPYLAYTRHLTGKWLYWGTGNDSMYWMTNTQENEYGSWFPDSTMHADEIFYSYYIPGCRDSIAKYHGEDLSQIYQKKNSIERDDLYRSMAVRNIKAHPVKYAKNIIYNAGRMLYQYPFTYGLQRPKLLIIFPVNGILLTLLLISLALTLINWKKVLFPLKILLFITFIYLGGSLLVCTYLRMFTIIVPMLVIWIGYISYHLIHIRLKMNTSDQNLP